MKDVEKTTQLGIYTAVGYMAALVFTPIIYLVNTVSSLVFFKQVDKYGKQ